jgi:hypothetical protein
VPRNSKSLLPAISCQKHGLSKWILLMCPASPSHFMLFLSPCPWQDGSWNPATPGTLSVSLEQVLSPSTGLWLIQAHQEVPGRTNGTRDRRDGTTVSLIPGPKITDSCETWNLLLQLIAQLVAHWLVKPLKFVHNVRSVSSFSESIGKWQLANWEQLRTCAHRSHRSHRSHCAVLQAQLSRSIFI